MNQDMNRGVDRGVDRDVVIVGAGPTGLLLAGDLAAAGVGVTVVEQRPEQESNLTRAFAVHARTLELLDARGLADELVSTGATVRELRFFRRLRVDLSTLPTRFPYVLITPQYNVEQLLERRARQHGAEILRGTRLRAIRQSGDDVDVVTEQGSMRARYAVGADGARSSVRRVLGSTFPGRTVARSVMLADVRLAEAPDRVITGDANGHAFGFIAPFGDGWYRVIAWRRDRQLPDDAPVDLEEIRTTVRAALGTDYGMHDARWTSRFHSDERQVPRYRVGRVFLAGDAAHVHSPAGGQGMNTGLQDAANLSWKLAADLGGWARPGLLDTYQTERHPAGRQVLRISGGILRVAFARPIPFRAASTIAAAAVRVPPIARRAAGTVSGIALRYPRPPGAHEFVGRRAPDLALAVHGRLYESLRDGRFVAVGANPGVGGGHLGVGSDPGVGDDPGVVGAQLRALRPVQPGPAMLIRPDGYIGWASDDATTADIRRAARDWGLVGGADAPPSDRSRLPAG